MRQNLKVYEDGKLIQLKILMNLSWARGLDAWLLCFLVHKYSSRARAAAVRDGHWS